MKLSGFTEEQVIGILREQGAGATWHETSSTICTRYAPIRLLMPIHARRAACRLTISSPVWRLVRPASAIVAATFLLQPITVAADRYDMALAQQTVGGGDYSAAGRAHSRTPRWPASKIPPVLQRRLTSWRNRCAAWASNGKCLSSSINTSFGLEDCASRSSSRLTTLTVVAATNCLEPESPRAQKRPPGTSAPMSGCPSSGTSSPLAIQGAGKLTRAIWRSHTSTLRRLSSWPASSNSPIQPVANSSPLQAVQHVLRSLYREQSGGCPGFC